MVKYIIKREENDIVYTYEVYNKTRRTYCTITSEELLEVGQNVLVKFDNEGLDGLHECEVIERLNGIQKLRRKIDEFSCFLQNLIFPR